MRQIDFSKEQIALKIRSTALMSWSESYRVCHKDTDTEEVLVTSRYAVKLPAVFILDVRNGVLH